MPTHYDPGFRFQFSLRTFLIVISVLGVGLGILGRLFLNDPPVFLIVLSILSYIGPFLLAIITIFWLGFRPKPAWLTPICGACKYDFGSANTNRLTNCPECGAKLSEPNAVLFPSGPTRRWGLIIWGGLLLLMPFIGFATLFVAQRFIGSSPSDLRFQSTQQLIQRHLPKQIDAPWVWRELEYRLNNKSLSQQEADDAIKKLTSYMTSQPSGWNRPLSWQNDFLISATQKRMISDPVLFGLCDAFYGSKPVIQMPRLRAGKIGFQIEIEYGNPFGNLGPGIELVWQVQRVLIDDKPVKLQQNYRHSHGWQGFVEGSEMSAGDHKVTVELECAYMDHNKIVGLNMNDLPIKSWPQARKRWKQSVSATMHVYPVEKPIIALVTDAARDPGPQGGVKIIRFFVQAERDGRKKIVLKIEFDKVLAVPLSYDVSVAFNGQSTKLGQMWISRSGNRQASSGDQLEAIVDKLAPTVLSGDIILAPNPGPIEQRPEVSEIWGKKTVLQNVQMERLDLEE